MVEQWIKDCKNAIIELKGKLQNATSEEEKDRIADSIADYQQSLYEYEGRMVSMNWETDYLNGEL